MKEQLIEEFRKFLQKKNAEGAFMNGIIAYGRVSTDSEDAIKKFCLNYHCVTDWSTSCFSWSRAFPSRPFWETLHIEWGLKCNELVETYGRQIDGFYF